MATTKSLSLTPIVDVQITLGAVSAPRNSFNLGLIIGSSTKTEPLNETVIPTAERIRIYTDLDDMLSDGYTTDSPEYKAAVLMKSATPLAPLLGVGIKQMMRKQLMLFVLVVLLMQNGMLLQFVVLLRMI